MMSTAVRPVETVHTHVAAKYYGWFDWLRFALALVVLLYHEGVFHWEQAGNFGVQVFFALSGWLIGGILCKTERYELKRFYFNRAIRIWCPYLLTLTFLIAGSLLHDHITGKWFEIVFYKLTFVYNIFGTPQLAHFVALFPLQGTGNHLWSVNAEDQFYLLSPLLLVILPRKVGRNVLTWGALAVVALLTHIYASIVFGVFAAVCASRYGAYNERPWCRLGSAVLVLAASAALMAGMNYELIAPFCAIGIVLFFAIPTSANRVGEFFGGISYPLYLNAWVAGIIVSAVFKHFHINNHRLGTFTVTIAAVVVASLLYEFFDKRIRNMRTRLYTPQRGALAVFIAYSAVILGCTVGLMNLWVLR